MDCIILDYFFPPFSCIVYRQTVTEDVDRQSRNDSCGTFVEHTPFVHENIEIPCSRYYLSSSNTTNCVLSSGAGKNPSIKENETL